MFDCSPFFYLCEIAAPIINMPTSEVIISSSFHAVQHTGVLAVVWCGALERKEAEWWDKGGRRRGGWMAGAAAAVSSLTCAPAPCGLFPASSCRAWRLQHSPLLELNWTGLLAVRSAASALPAPHTHKNPARSRISLVTYDSYDWMWLYFLSEKQSQCWHTVIKSFAFPSFKTADSRHQLEAQAAQELKVTP